MEYTKVFFFFHNNYLQIIQLNGHDGKEALSSVDNSIVSPNKFLSVKKNESVSVEGCQVVYVFQYVVLCHFLRQPLSFTYYFLSKLSG